MPVQRTIQIVNTYPSRRTTAIQLIDLPDSRAIILVVGNSIRIGDTFLPSQVPVVLLIGMPDGAGKQTGGEEESEFLDGRIHDQI